MRRVILSDPIILEVGLFRVTEISLTQAYEWVKENCPENYCSSQIVKALGIEPLRFVDFCKRYDEALCLKPIGKFDHYLPYSRDEILDIGVTCMLIKKMEEIK